MTKEEILKLTHDLYRLTLLFPKKEPLKYKIREIGIEILADLTKWIEKIEGGEKDLIFQISRNLSALRNLLLLSLEQNWVKKEEILKIGEKYDKIKENVTNLLKTEKIEKPVLEVKEELKEEPKISFPFFWERKELEKRQKKILRILQEKKKIQIGELCKRFPQVSRRTLLRDLERLLELGYVTREGEGRGAFYRFVFPKKSS